MNSTTVKTLSLDEVSELRGISQNISRQLSDKVEGYLNTLTALFAPRKVLGEHLQTAGEGRVAGAEANFKAIATAFEGVTKQAFSTNAKLGSPVPPINGKVALSPWQYKHVLADSGETVIINSPVRWILHYQSDYAASDLIQDILQKDVSQEGAKQFTINALTIARLFYQSPELHSLFSDLRFPVSVEETEWVKSLPLAIVGCELPVIRPQDEVIAKVTSLSGNPVFEELIDTDSIADLPDPFLADLVPSLA